MQEPHGIVWISETIYAWMIQEANRALPNETGGVLVGYWVNSPLEAVIAKVIGPGPKAIHKPTSFLPDDDFQFAEIEEQYRKSGRLYTYLGDWHTHPKERAYLSRTDRQTLRKISNYPGTGTSVPLMAVLGDGAVLKIWRYAPARFRWLRSVPLEVEMRLKRYS